jgi:hypothetical protein
VKRIHIAVLACSLVVAAMLGACTSAATDPTPSQAPSTTSISRAVPAAVGPAPQVSQPLNAARFAADPCASLTIVQIRSLKYVGKAAGMCNWLVEKNDDSVVVTWFPSGLTVFYAQSAAESYWQPTSVEGYPAVFASSVDARDDGACRINVGINDAMMFAVDYTAESSPSSCDSAKAVAAEVIHNVRAAQ